MPFLYCSFSLTREGVHHGTPPIWLLYIQGIQHTPAQGVIHQSHNKPAKTMRETIPTQLVASLLIVG